MGKHNRTTKIIFSSGLILLLAQTVGFAQVIEQVKNGFNQYRQRNVQEKIYVHTDKSVYLPGDRKAHV